MFELFDSALLKSKIFWITAVVFVFYLYFKAVVYTYWKRHCVPHAKPTLVLGNVNSNLFMKKISLGNIIKNSYEQFKKYPFHGLYMLHSPVLMINDPELIKYVLVKNFSSFVDRGTEINDKIDPLSGHLFFLTGDRWRKLRIKLSPTLTSGKLKYMYPFVQEIANELVNVINGNLESSDIIEVKDLVARYTTDTISSLAFGFNANCLKYPNSEFRFYGDLAIKNNPIRNILAFFAPNVLEHLKIPFNNRKVITFFSKLFTDMVEKRKNDMTNRKDFLNQLIELMDNKNCNDDTDGAMKLEILEAAAQAFVFFIAGFETSSSIITHTLYELALNPKEQEKVHQEIDQILEKDGGFNYENVARMEYLEMAFYETMRKHASLPFLNRICVKECQLPNSDYIVPKGMPLLISISGLHMDPDIYPEPQKYDPTRFSKENIATRHPYTYLPFGEGPRICIGKRLGILESMVALSTLLSKFEFSTCDKTPIPNYYMTESVLQTPRDGIYLRLKKRNVK